MRLYSFEKLEVWRLSRDLTIMIYKLSSNFPKTEQYGIANQIRRASFSISNNLAEGSSRTTNKEKIRYIEIAFGSLLEVLNILILSVELKLIEKADFQKLRTLIEEIGNKLNALKKSFSPKSL
jgi:four helix bundle protein